MGGAAIADMMLYIESAKGLFHKIIMQSGTSWQSMYFGGQAKKRAKALAETLEWSAPSSSMLINYLKKVSAADICAAEDKSVHADEARSVQKGIAPFIPIVEHEYDEALITKMPEESNIDIDIPIMIGYNSREILDMGSRYLHKPQYLTFADRDFLMMLPIRTGFNLQINDNIYFEAIQEVRDFYFDEGYVKTKKPGEYLTYLGDGMVTYPIDYTVRQYVNKSKAPVYYYTFDYSGEWNWRKIENLQSAVSFDGTWGASATDDLSYLFIYNKERSAYRAAVLDKGESEELAVLKNMIRLRTNFAKYGNPTPEGDEFIWKPATKENKECLVITEELEMRNNLHEDRMKFWDDFIEKYRAKAIDGVVYDVKEEL
uniref:Carboxylesterase 2 n=1 Tax=Conopomorpha sinensis TaxID=940481 RepID=A0A346TPC3_9NEOP|nr:carboxylesterase 2 [Conopomorpha sinensis]